MNPQDISFDWEGRTITQVQCYREDDNSDNYADIKVQMLDKEFREKYFDRITFPYNKQSSEYIKPDIANPQLIDAIFKAAFNKLGEPVSIIRPENK